LFYDPFSIPLEEKTGKKRILVIGGGDIAFDYAATLLHGGHEVTIISRSEPTCLPLLCDRALKNGATLHSSCVPEQLVKHRKDIHLTCRQNNQETRFFADFILIACGREPNISFLSSRLKEFLQSTQNIPQTALPGFYVAGDVVRGAFRQTGIAVGDGIHAAMMVEQYLKDRTVRP
jgi:thioredoxin reductase